MLVRSEGDITCSSKKFAASQVGLLLDLKYIYFKQSKITIQIESFKPLYLTGSGGILYKQLQNYFKWQTNLFFLNFFFCSTGV
jgi:hypothetical protein